MQYTIIQKIHTYVHKNESKHSEMGPVRQNPIQRPVRSVHMWCIALCTIVAHDIVRNRPDSFPSYPPDNHHCSDDVYLREGGKLSKPAQVKPIWILMKQEMMGVSGIS